MQELIIVELPSNLGLIEPGPGREPGVKKLPEWLKTNGLHELLHAENTYTLLPPAYTMEIDSESGVRNANSIISFAIRQAELLKKLLMEKKIVVALGGDCSILIGNALAMKQIGRYGLFFLDGHTDYMMPELSGTHGAAGMDLAIVTGNGHPKLTRILEMGPYIREEDVWCVGNREFDPCYVKSAQDSQLNYFDLHQLRDTGPEDCARSFLNMINSRGLEGFWIHLDVDVLDDELMPAVDSREKGGLSYAELRAILNTLLASPKAAGIEITILDPDLDPDMRYTQEFVREIGPLLSNLKIK